jgi:hypothetical protein
MSLQLLERLSDFDKEVRMSHNKTTLAAINPYLLMNEVRAIYIAKHRQGVKTYETNEAMDNNYKLMALSIAMGVFYYVHYLKEVPKYRYITYEGWTYVN